MLGFSCLRHADICPTVFELVERATKADLGFNEAKFLASPEVILMNVADINGRQQQVQSQSSANDSAGEDQDTPIRGRESAQVPEPVRDPNKEIPQPVDPEPEPDDQPIEVPDDRPQEPPKTGEDLKREQASSKPM